MPLAAYPEPSGLDASHDNPNRFRFRYEMDPRLAAILEMLVGDPETLGGLTQFAILRPSRGRKSLTLKRRDVRVVEGARLESDAAEPHGTIPKRLT